MVFHEIKNVLGLVLSLSLICTLTSTVLAAPVVNRDINSYVLFAYDQLIFKGGSLPTWGNIVGGNIGVNNVNGSIDFELVFATSNGARMSDGTQAVADSVRGDAGGSFYDLFANSVNPSFASTIRGSGPLSYTTPIIPTGSLPTLPFTPNRALTNGPSDSPAGTATNLTIPDNGTYTMAVGAYRDVRFNDGAVITFGAGTFDMRSLSIGKNVTVNVTDNTILQIDQNWFNNIGLKLGVGTNAGCKIYIGAYGINSNTTRATGFSTGAEIHAQYFAPTGWLDIGGQNNIYGRYWAKKITGDPNNNVYFQIPETTAIELSSFTAIPNSNKVYLKWDTETEKDNAGFNIYRAEAADGEYTKINDLLISAEGSSTQGASYEYVDKGVQNRTTY